MKNLIEILREQTNTLKNDFVNKMKNWADKEYDRLIVRKDWTVEDWCNFMHIEPEMSKYQPYKLTFPRNFHNTAKSKIYDRFRKELGEVVYITKEEYINKQEKYAETHYENSIIKLATRIRQKNLDESKIVVKTSKLNQNIETILTDGTKTIRAFTVFASGEIQRPHYRYLIK